MLLFEDDCGEVLRLEYHSPALFFQEAGLNGHKKRVALLGQPFYDIL